MAVKKRSNAMPKRREIYGRWRSRATRWRRLLFQQLESRNLLAGDSIAPASVNHPPVANDDHLEALEDMALDIPGSMVMVNDFDADGDALSVDIATQPAHG